MFPFNESKDKITEREMVYDILERLSFGENLKDENITYANASTKLTDYLNRINKMIFPADISNIGSLKTLTMKIAQGTSTGVVTTTGLAGVGRVVRAISQQTGMDYTDLCSINTIEGISSITFNCAVPLLHDEYLTLFLE